VSTLLVKKLQELRITLMQGLTALKAKLTSLFKAN
jgi:hypothetical protein